jgi:hypothetical protein
MSGSAVGFEITARRESRLGCVIVQRLRMIGFPAAGFALEEQNFAWTGHLAGRQSLANKNIDSAEAQPYAFLKPSRFWQRSANC